MISWIGGLRGEGIIHCIDSFSYLFIYFLQYFYSLHSYFLLLPEFPNCKNLRSKYQMQVKNGNCNKENKKRDALSTSYPPTSYYLQCRTLNFKCNSPIPQHRK